MKTFRRIIVWLVTIIPVAGATLALTYVMMYNSGWIRLDHMNPALYKQCLVTGAVCLSMVIISLELNISLD